MTLTAITHLESGLTGKLRAGAHLGFLDGIRGWAAMWVLASHCLLMTGTTFPIVTKAHIAVDIFMMMSGFLMMHHFLEREKNEPLYSVKTWRNFYLRRFFRIAPLYYLIFAIALLVSSELGSFRHVIASAYPKAMTNFEKYTDFSFANIFSHLTFLFGFSPQYCVRTPLPDWSIGLEMQFYLFFPLIVMMLRRFSYFFGAALLVMISIAIYKTSIPDHFAKPAFLPLRIHYFTIGILLATAFFYSRNKSKSINPQYLILAAICIPFLRGAQIVAFLTLLICSILFYDRENDTLGIRKFVVFVENILGGRLSVFMADTSYSVYLIHVLFLLPIAGLLAARPEYMALPATVRFAAVFLPTTFLSYATGWLLFCFVEKPGIVLGKRIVSGLAQGK